MAYNQKRCAFIVNHECATLLIVYEISNRSEHEISQHIAISVIKTVILTFF